MNPATKGGSSEYFGVEVQMSGIFRNPNVNLSLTPTGTYFILWGARDPPSSALFQLIQVEDNMKDDAKEIHIDPCTKPLINSIGEYSTTDIEVLKKALS